MAREMTLREKLIELGRALEYALERPAVEKAGILRFSVLMIGKRDPISISGGRCPTAKRVGYYTLPDLATLAGLVKEYAGKLPGETPDLR